MRAVYAITTEWGIPKETVVSKTECARD